MNLDKLSNMVRKTFKPTEVEAKLQEALSKKNWGASSTVMNDISRYTFDYQEYSVVMKAVWDGVNEKGINWRVVFKALSLLIVIIVVFDSLSSDNERKHYLLIIIIYINNYTT